MSSATNVAPRRFAQARDAWLSPRLADRRYAPNAKVPKRETLMAETGLGRTTVGRHLKQLERLGAFQVERGRYNHKTKKRAVNRYIVPKTKVDQGTTTAHDQGTTGGPRLNEKNDSMNKKEREKHKMGLPRGPSAPEKEPSTDSPGPSPQPAAFEVPRPQGGWWDRLDEPPLLTCEEQAALGRLKKGAA
jgi:DNA-binding transcriptional MocR family regulator